MITALAIAATGCATPASNEPRASSSLPTSAPLSDETLSEAADQALSVYLAASDAVAKDGGSSPERLKSLVTPRQYEVELEDAQSLQAAKVSARGSTVARNLKIQERDESELRAYVCIDSTGFNFVNAAGEAVVPADEGLHSAVVMFGIEGGTPTELLIDGFETWSGDSIC
jgi:hypothetical protein